MTAQITLNSINRVPWSRHLWLLLLSVLILAACSGTRRPEGQCVDCPVSQETTTRLAEAWKLHRAGRHEQAFNIYEELLKHHPQATQVYWERSLWLSSLDRSPEAIADLRRFTALDPFKPRPWGYLGRELLLEGAYPEAREALTKARALDPEDWSWVMMLGHTAWRQGDREGARRWYREAIPLIADEKTLQKARQDLRNFLFLEPRAAQAEADWFEAAVREALPTNRRVAQGYRRADHLFAVAARGSDARDKKHRDADAARLFLQAADVERGTGRPRRSRLASALLKAAHQYELIDNREQAVNLYRQVWLLNRAALPAGHPDIVWVAGSLGFMLSLTGHYSEAEPLLREALQALRARADAVTPMRTNEHKPQSPIDCSTVARRRLPPKEQEGAAQDCVASMGLLRSLAVTLAALGDVLAHTNRTGDAEAAYREALAIRETLVPRGDDALATIRNQISGLLGDSGQYDRLIQFSREVLARDRGALPEGHFRIFEDLGGLALAQILAGKGSEAEPLLAEALKIARSPGLQDHPRRGEVLLDTAALLMLTGRLTEGTETLQQAIESLKSAEEPPPESFLRTLKSHLGTFFLLTGDYPKAESVLRKVLDSTKASLPAGAPQIADAMANLAAALAARGNLAEAEGLYREVLGLRRRTRPADPQAMATSLLDLGGFLATTGRHRESEGLMREAEELRRRSASADAAWTDLPYTYKTANILSLTGNSADAARAMHGILVRLRAALPTAHPFVGVAMNALAVALMETGRSQEADTLLQDSAGMLKAGLPPGSPGIAVNLSNQGTLLLEQGRVAEAEPLLRRALQIAVAVGDPELLVLVSSNLAVLYQTQGQLPLAILFAKRAVNTLQGIRQDLAKVGSTAQQQFAKSREDYYRQLADLLIAEGRLAEAQQVLTMLKEAEYFQFIRRDTTADPRVSRADLSPVEAEQQARLDREAKQLVALAEEQRRLLDAREPLDATAEAHLAELDARLTEAGRRFQETLNDLKANFAALSAERREQLATRQVLNGVDDRALLRDLSERTHAPVALLQVLVMPDKVHLLLTLPELQIIHRQVALPEVDLNRQVEAFRTALQDPTADPRPAAQRLYQLLIAPVAAAFEEAGIHTLMVSLDGTLRYVPMAALYDGQRYLVERYALAVFSDLQRTHLLDTPAPNWHGVGLGVSAEHRGVGPEKLDFGKLRAVPGELKAIFRGNAGENPAAVLPGPIYLDPEFTVSRLRQSLRQPVLHIATHFSLKPGDEAQSFLLLGDGKPLYLSQLRTYKLDLGSIDLLTLSACDTAMGADATGVELDSLANVAKTSAKAVLATLWPVADESTGQFMRELYRLRVDRKLDKAEALRQVQLAFLRRAAGTAPTATEPRRQPESPFHSSASPTATTRGAPADSVAHPYYWAPFILMGNWL